MSGIFIKIDGDSTDYQKAINQATTSTEQFDKRSNASLKKLKDSFDNTSKAVTDLDKTTGRTRNNMRGFNNVIGQAGFQVQDLAVQLQSGTSAFVAFGQQGSQLAGAFGPGGAVVGAIIAVGAAVGGVLVNSLGSATQSAEDLQERILGLGKDLQDLTRDQREFLASQEDEKIKELQKEFGKLSKEIGKTTQNLELAEAGLLKFGGRTASAKRQKEAAKELREELAELQAQFQTVFQEIEAGNKKANKIRSGVDPENEERRLSNIEDITEALRLQAETLGFSNEEKARALALQLEATPAQLAEIDAIIEKIDDYNKEIEAEKTRTKEKLEQAKERERIEREESATAAREARAREAVARQEAAAIAAAKSGLYNQLITTVTAANDLLFKDSKDAATANAIVAGLEASVQAYKWGATIGGPIGGAAAAGLAATATGLQIAKIRQTTRSGGGAITGPGSSGNIDSQIQQQAQTQQNVNIAITGETVSKAQFGNFIEELNDLLADGATLKLS